MPELAPIFVDDARVRLLGKAKPKVARIAYAAGKQAGNIQVQRLQRQEDPQGQPLRMADVIDRTQSSNAVYLRIIDRPARDSTMGPHGHGVNPI